MNMIMTCDICSIASILLAGGCTVLGIYIALLRDEIAQANAAAEHFEKQITELKHNLSNAPKPRKRDAKGRYIKA